MPFFFLKGVPAKRVTGGNARKTTTVLACVSADGGKMPPMILHKGKRIWDNMMGENAYPGTSYAVSENGWMTEYAFNNWFKETFLTHIKTRPVLLIYDGHLSHISMELVQMAIESEVTILKLPPHTSHILQPLDVCVFKGIKTTWDSVLAGWAKHNYGKHLPKSEFANVLGKVWGSIKTEVIKKGFEKTGIFDSTTEFPVNRYKIDEKNFSPEKLERYKTRTVAPEAEPFIEPVRVIEIEPAIASDATVEMYLSSPSPLIPVMMPSKSFEALLLKTVTPKSDVPTKKRRRIDDAEIITNDSFLQKLQDQDKKKQLESEEKAEKKLKVAEKRAEMKKIKEEKKTENNEKKAKNSKKKITQKKKVGKC